MTDNKKSKFGLGLLIGTIVGGLTAFFFSPTSGPENREELKKLLKETEIDKKVKEIFGEVTEESRKIYTEAKELLIDGLAQLQETVKNIDKEKYMAVVEDVMKNVQKTVKKDAKQLNKLKKQLIKEWEKLQRSES